MGVRDGASCPAVITRRTSRAVASWRAWSATSSSRSAKLFASAASSSRALPPARSTDPRTPRPTPRAVCRSEDAGRLLAAAGLALSWLVHRTESVLVRRGMCRQPWRRVQRSHSFVQCVTASRTRRMPARRSPDDTARARPRASSARSPLAHGEAHTGEQLLRLPKSPGHSLPLAPVGASSGTGRGSGTSRSARPQWDSRRGVSMTPSVRRVIRRTDVRRVASASVLNCRACGCDASSRDPGYNERKDKRELHRPAPMLFATSVR